MTSFAQHKANAWNAYMADFRANPLKTGVARRFYTEWYAPSMRGWPQQTPPVPSP